MALVLNKVCHSYHELPVLDDVSLCLNEGEFCCLTGPSGCGKSTLLRVVAGFEKASAGSIKLDGAPLSPRTGQIGMVFQTGALFPWLNVRKNISFGLEALGVKGPVRSRRVDYYLELVGLSQFAGYYPHQLSGGMRQRLALARALAYDPKLVLMDEPFASLDAQSRNAMQVELIRIWGETKKTILFVTHSIDEAVFLADQVVVMSRDPGTIKSSFPISLPRPRQRTGPPFVRTRQEILNLMEQPAISTEPRPREGAIQ